MDEIKTNKAASASVSAVESLTAMMNQNDEQEDALHKLISMKMVSKNKQIKKLTDSLRAKDKTIHDLTKEIKYQEREQNEVEELEYQASLIAKLKEQINESNEKLAECEQMISDKDKDLQKMQQIKNKHHKADQKKYTNLKKLNEKQLKTINELKASLTEESDANNEISGGIKALQQKLDESEAKEQDLAETIAALMQSQDKRRTADKELRKRCAKLKKSNEKCMETINGNDKEMKALMHQIDESKAMAQGLVKRVNELEEMAKYEHVNLNQYSRLSDAHSETIVRLEATVKELKNEKKINFDAYTKEIASLNRSKKSFVAKIEHLGREIIALNDEIIRKNEDYVQMVTDKDLQIAEKDEIFQQHQNEFSEITAIDQAQIQKLQHIVESQTEESERTQNNLRQRLIENQAQNQGYIEIIDRLEVTIKVMNRKRKSNLVVEDLDGMTMNIKTRNDEIENQINTKVGIIQQLVDEKLQDLLENQMDQNMEIQNDLTQQLIEHKEENQYLMKLNDEYIERINQLEMTMEEMKRESVQNLEVETMNNGYNGVHNTVKETDSEELNDQIRSKDDIIQNLINEKFQIVASHKFVSAARTALIHNLNERIDDGNHKIQDLKELLMLFEDRMQDNQDKYQRDIMALMQIRQCDLDQIEQLKHLMLEQEIAAIHDESDCVLLGLKLC